MRRGLNPLRYIGKRGHANVEESDAVPCQCSGHMLFLPHHPWSAHSIKGAACKQGWTTEHRAKGCEAG